MPKPAFLLSLWQFALLASLLAPQNLAAELPNINLVGCAGTVYILNPTTGSSHIVQLQGLQRCDIGQVLGVPSLKQFLVLKSTDSEASTLSEHDFVVLRYSLPSLKLLNQVSLPGKFPADLELALSSDSKATGVILQARIPFAFDLLSSNLNFVDPGKYDFLRPPLQDDLNKMATIEGRQALQSYLAPSNKKSVVAKLVNSAQDVSLFELYSKVAETNMAILAKSGKLTVIEKAPYSIKALLHLAETADTLVLQEAKSVGPRRKPSPNGRVVLYSARSGSMLADLSFPELAGEHVRCLGQWHDELAIFGLPDRFVALKWKEKKLVLFLGNGPVDTDPEPLFLER